MQLSIQEQLLHTNEKRLRGGLVLKAHRWLYHSTLGARVIKKKKYLAIDVEVGAEAKRSKLVVQFSAGWGSSSYTSILGDV